MAAANEFLTGYFEGHNQRFAKAPAEAQNAHQAWEKGAVALSGICASRFERTLSKGLVVTFKSQRYALRGKKIEVCVHLDGRVGLLNDTASLPYRVFSPQLDKAPPADDKTVNERVEQALAKRGGQAHKPAQNHP